MRLFLAAMLFSTVAAGAPAEPRVELDQCAAVVYDAEGMFLCVNMLTFEIGLHVEPCDASFFVVTFVDGPYVRIIVDPTGIYCDDAVNVENVSWGTIRKTYGGID